MKNNIIIVRYGEIWLKAKETRKRFEDTLINNIKKPLESKMIENKITKERGRIYIVTKKIDETIKILQKIFGITSISPAIQTDSNIDSISEIALEILKQKISKKKSFALRVTRTGNHDYTSQEIAIRIGQEIVDKTNAKVDLTNPDFKLYIEIRNQNSYLFTEKNYGPGGLPIGTQGNILALIEDKASILAAWYMMKRGCNIIFLTTVNNYKKELNKFLSRWYVDFEIHSDKIDNYDFVYHLIKKKNIDAIATGHILYKQSKKNIEDIFKLKKHMQIPILTPLINMGKEGIIQKSREIGISI